MTIVTSVRSALLAVAALAACSPGDQIAQSPPQELGDPTDNTGVYTGTVGGKPGFMVTFQTLHAEPFTVISITQRGTDVSAFGGGGLSATEQAFDFAQGWPGGGGEVFINGVRREPRGAVITGTWTISERIAGSARQSVGSESLLDFDLQFDPVSLETAPAGDAIPTGQYDIIHNGADIGDFTVETAGAGTGSVTWPGASEACAIAPSTGVRAPGTTRNVWQIQFNTDVDCTPSAWSVGYAVTSGGGLTYELFASRALANHGRPAPAGQQDVMHIQLRRR